MKLTPELIPELSQLFTSQFTDLQQLDAAIDELVEAFRQSREIPMIDSHFTGIEAVSEAAAFGYAIGTVSPRTEPEPTEPEPEITPSLLLQLDIDATNKRVDQGISYKDFSAKIEKIKEAFMNTPHVQRTVRPGVSLNYLAGNLAVGFHLGQLFEQYRRSLPLEHKD